ncbi:sensor histidine kinase [Bacillus licheniformis]|nr:sensor histidine kinase [Bacillus licheniformis]
MEDQVKITVADEGCGIPEEERDYIFERFTGSINRGPDKPAVPGWVWPS